MKPIFVSLFYLMGCSILPAGEDSARLVFAEVLQSTLDGHPALREVQARWEAARARVPQAAAWEDPMLGTTVMQKGERRGHAFTEAEVMLSQQLPFSGIPKARSRLAEAEAAAAWETVGQVRSRLIGETRSAFVAYAGAWERLRLNSEHQKLLEEAAEIAQAKVETREARLADALQARTEISLLRDSREDLMMDQAEARVRLNALLRQPVGNSLPPPEPLIFVPLKANLEEMTARALRHRPELLMAQQDRAASEARVDLARRSSRADPSLQVTSRHLAGAGAGIQEVDVGISIPLKALNAGKYQGIKAEAAAAREAADQAYHSARWETERMVGEAYEKAAAAAERYRILRDEVVPQARQTLEARRADFATRQASFLEYNAARITLQGAETALYDRLIAYRDAVAALDTMTENHSASPRHQP